MNLKAPVSSCLVVLCGLGPAACTRSEFDDPDGWEHEDSLESPQSEFADPDGLEAEESPQERDILICDAIYLPFITFTFTDAATGQAYCGPAAVTYEVVEGEGPITVLCECEDGNMMRQGWSVCHVNPPEGETSIISVSAPSYDVFVTEVTLPYICHPQAQVAVLFQPRTEDPPECAGMVTADLGAGPDGCPQAWFHGEQMCPQEAWCDLVLQCMAYSDWPVGTCRCGEAPNITCCPITIANPKDGDSLTQSADIDPAEEGIQIEVTVDIDCWYIQRGSLYIHACEDPPGEAVVGFEHPDHLITGTVDIGTAAGCIPIYAEIMLEETIVASDRIEVCVPPG